MKIVVPMAGNGQRFKDVGYELPKPLIQAVGKSIIAWAYENLQGYSGEDYIFIVRQDHVDEFNIDKYLKTMVPGCNVVILSGPTQGALCTVLTALPFIKPNEELVIANSDQYIQDFSIHDFLEQARLARADGSIVTFEADSAKWSFVKLNKEGTQIVEVAEKRPISRIATAGIYYFKDSTEFVYHAKNMIDEEKRTNGEFYLCPIYNEFIEAGNTIVEYRVDNMNGLGTPEDLDLFFFFRK